MKLLGAARSTASPAVSGSHGQAVGDQGAAVDLAADLASALAAVFGRLAAVERATAGLAAAATEGVDMANLRIADVERRLAVIEEQEQR